MTTAPKNIAASPHKSNILVKVTGSIAAFKAVALVSKLSQKGYKLRVVGSENSKKFIGESSFAALTGTAVYYDSFRSPMAHIELGHWADLIILAPATANTINKLAQGIADNLLTEIFLAYERDKPYLLAPAMNTRMLEHPRTKQSLAVLESWGVDVLASSYGYLACGETGMGKILEVEQLVQVIENKLIKHKLSPDKEQLKAQRQLSVLISSGGTSEAIDAVRSINNKSTGRTGAIIADTFTIAKHRVHYLHSTSAVVPNFASASSSFTDAQSLELEFQRLLEEQNFDLLIHLAAVSDFRVQDIEYLGASIACNRDLKIDSSKLSGASSLSILLKKNNKIVDRLRQWSSKKFILVAFKLTSNATKKQELNEVEKLFKHSTADFIVLNDVKNRSNNEQEYFQIFDRQLNIVAEPRTALDLAFHLETLG